MKTCRTDRQRLRCDEVFLAGVRASDVRSLWRALTRTHAVRLLARETASDPDRLRRLAALAEELLRRPHAGRCRHPEDLAVCAALVVLDRSPLGEVRALFARLAELESRPLIWVRRLAAYCAGRYVSSSYGRCEPKASAPPRPVLRLVSRRPRVARTRSRIGAAHARLPAV